jgi:hypothetical protein
MTLRLTNEYQTGSCPDCNGRGKVKHEDWQRKDGRWVAGGGWMPCEGCKEKKVVASPQPNPLASAKATVSDCSTV